MTTKNIPLLRRLAPRAAVGLLALLAACNVVPPAVDDPTRYYVLSDPTGQAVQAPAAGAVRIGLKTVTLESYLRRKEMVVRTGENEVEFRDFRRWAEPLDATIGRVLRRSLLGAAEVAQVYAEPFPADQERDYDVSIDVRRCEGYQDTSGRFSASFSAMIEISTAGASPRVVARKLFTAPAGAWDGRDFGRLANLLSADISALGQEIVADIPARN
jgi:hypothetical protein